MYGADINKKDPITAQDVQESLWSLGNMYIRIPYARIPPEDCYFGKGIEYLANRFGQGLKFQLILVHDS